MQLKGTESNRVTQFPISEIIAIVSYEVLLDHFTQRKLKTKDPIKFFRFHSPSLHQTFTGFQIKHFILLKGIQMKFETGFHITKQPA